MAIAHICDRCGKLIPHQTLIMGQTKIEGFTALITPMANMRGNNDSYDLCAGCAEKLKIWIKNIEFTEEEK